MPALCFFFVLGVFPTRTRQSSICPHTHAQTHTHACTRTHTCAHPHARTHLRKRDTHSQILYRRSEVQVPKASRPLLNGRVAPIKATCHLSRWAIAISTVTALKEVLVKMPSMCRCPVRPEALDICISCCCTSIVKKHICEFEPMSTGTRVATTEQSFQPRTPRPRARTLCKGCLLPYFVQVEAAQYTRVENCVFSKEQIPSICPTSTPRIQ